MAEQGRDGMLGYGPATEIAENVRILPHFERYCRHGYYPFYKEDLEGFHAKLMEVAQQTIELDMPAVDKVEYITIQKLKKLLGIIALQVPFVPKMEELYRQLETSREQGLKLLDLLERGALLGQLKTRVKAFKQMSSPEKLFLDNTNLMYAFNPNPAIGTVRETYFYNQTCHNHELNAPKQGDFLVDRHITLEVGGHNKTFDQIADMPDSYVLADMLEYPIGKKLPLWIVGLMY